MQGRVRGINQIVFSRHGIMDRGGCYPCYE